MKNYPIRTISELTGVATTTLRAWERRYGLLNPDRTPKGHRLYGSEDIDLIKEIVRLLKSGRTISEAIRIVKNPELNVTEETAVEGHWAVFQQRILKSIENFNEQNLGSTYNEALSIYPVDIVTEKVIMPVLDVLGNRWKNRAAGIAEEHFFSTFLRNKLGARLHHESNKSRGKKILVACLPDEYHELGILLFCIAALGRGYQILYLGTNLPPSQITEVIERTNVSAVLLSGTKTDLWKKEVEEELRKNISTTKIPFMFGGKLSEKHKESLESLGAFVLGADHVQAMEKMQEVVPAFSASTS